MSMLDDLDATERIRSGPICGVQRLKQAPVKCPNDDCDADTHGFGDAMEVLTVDGYTWSQRQHVLAKHGYTFDKQLIGRHTTNMLQSGNGCKRCTEWLS